MNSITPHEGPGPMILRVDQPDGDAPLGSVMIDFFPAHARLSVMANNEADEAVIRARVDAWAVDHARGLLRDRTKAASGCGDRCPCRGGEQA